MTKISMRVSLLALVLCISAFFMPLTLFAASDDTTPPTVTVEYSDGKLAITTTDDSSGVEAVYIDGHRVSSIVNGAATVTLQDYAGNNQMVSIYAVDFAGNRSNTVQVNNPYYTAPVASSQVSSTSTAASSALSSTTSTSVAQASQSSSVSVVSSSTTSKTDSNSTGSNGDTAFTPDGTGTVVDNVTDADGKEFYTFTTAEGNVFYLVVDKERASDNVYFLNAVTESDLMALAEQDGVTVIPGESAIPGEVEAPDPLPEDDGEEEPNGDEQAEKTSNAGMILFIVIIAAAVGGVGYYLKVVKPRQQTDLDYEDDEDEGYEDENGEDIEFADDDDFAAEVDPAALPEAFTDEYDTEFEPEGEE